VELSQPLSGRPRAAGKLSRYLLEQHDLHRRAPTSQQVAPWTLWNIDRLERLASELAVAMLGGWVRQGLTREAVAAQLAVLSPRQRLDSLAHARRLGHLPFPSAGRWPLRDKAPSALPDLGLSCLCSLLEDRESGTRCRFRLRLAPDRVSRVSLSVLQRKEAEDLVAQHASAGTHERSGQELNPMEARP
jgi:hypothetical protein